MSEPTDEQIIRALEQTLQNEDINSISGTHLITKVSNILTHNTPNADTHLHISSVVANNLIDQTEKLKSRLREDFIGRCTECNAKKGENVPKISCVILGFGMAGSAHFKDIQQNPHFHLEGVVTRRANSVSTQQPNINILTWEDVCQQHQIQAVFISTENHLHFGQALDALKSGKHVSVDYPLCLSQKETETLYETADASGVHLHVEYITLLTLSYQKLKQDILKGLDKSTLRKASLHFSGGVSRAAPLPEWKDRHNDNTSAKQLFENLPSGFPSFSGIVRLVRLLDWFGDLKLVNASIRVFQEPISTLPLAINLQEKGENTESIPFQIDGFRLEVTFQSVSITNSDAPINWIEERVKGGKRETTFSIEFEDESVINEEPSLFQPAGLFQMDNCLFAHRIHQTSANKPDSTTIPVQHERWLTLRASALAQEIQDICTLIVQSR